MGVPVSEGSPPIVQPASPQAADGGCEVQGEAGASSGRPRVLVVGAAGTGKATLVNTLLSSELEPQTGTSAILEGVQLRRWAVDTKYYTADLDVLVARLADNATESCRQDKLQALAADCEALLLVFDVNQLDTITAVQHWVATTELESCEVRLCVGNKADLLQGGSHQGREDWQSWCIDSGIEYVEACACDERYDLGGVDGERQGVARVRDALHAHMWPGLVLKPRPGFDATSAMGLGADCSSHDEEATLSDGPLSPTSHDGLGRYSILDDTPEPNLFLSSMLGDAPDELGSDGDDTGMLHEIEQLEKLMLQASSFRQNSRNLSDHDRRAVAARLAMQMQTLFGDASSDVGTP